MLNKQELNLLRQVYNHPEFKALQAENKKLKNLVKKLEKTNQKLTQNVKTVAAKSAKYQTKYKAKEQQLKTFKAHFLKPQTSKPFVSEKPKSAKIPFDTGLDRSKWFRDTIYAPRFIQRLSEHFGNDMKPEWLGVIQSALNKLAPIDIYFIVRELGLKVMYYESDSSYYANMPVVEYTAEDIYEKFSKYNY